MTAEEYLAIERRAETRSEFIDGEMLAMAGVDRRHNRIVCNIVAALTQQFKGRRCGVHASDVRVKIPATGNYVYPDVSALCGEEQFEDAHVDTLLNPSVVIEVLSKSTELYDRNGKFDGYRSLPSFQEYVLISRDRVRVEHYIKRQEGWSWSVHDNATAVLELPSVHATLLVGDIYDKVAF